MRAINHALTGAVVGFTVGKPLVAIPLAVVSHFICDALPHYSREVVHTEKQKEKLIRSRWFRYWLYADAFLCLTLVGVLDAAHTIHWLLAASCAFAAAAPDFLAIPRFIDNLRHKTYHPNVVTRFTSAIQWFERPIGGVVEVAWFIGAAVLLSPFLR